MALGNTFSNYGAVAKSFHWLTALLIITTFAVGYLANQIAHQITSPDFDGAQNLIDRAFLLFSVHKTLGVVIFFVALARILWAVFQTKPGLLHPDRKAEAMAAETVHWILYGSLVMVPLTGWIHHAATTGYAPIYWPFGQTLPFVPKSESVAELFGVLHWLLVWVLFCAVGLHIAGAIKHHVIDRDSTLLRMLPGNPAQVEPPAQSHSATPAVAAVIVWAAAIAGAVFLGYFSHPKHTESAATQLAEVNSDWVVQSGTLRIGVTQAGSKVEGSFADWTADITFDEPNAPGPAGSVDVVISIGSLTLGTVTSQAMGKDFFDSEQFPTARFTANIEKLEQGYQATGTLTIRDQTMPLILPFALELDGDRAKMNGQVKLNRMEYGIGQSVTDPGSLAFEVDVMVELDATRGG